LHKKTTKYASKRWFFYFRRNYLSNKTIKEINKRSNDTLLDEEFINGEEHSYSKNIPYEIKSNDKSARNIIAVSAFHYIMTDEIKSLIVNDLITTDSISKKEKDKRLKELLTVSMNEVSSHATVSSLYEGSVYVIRVNDNKKAYVIPSVYQTFKDYTTYKLINKNTFKSKEDKIRQFLIPFYKIISSKTTVSKPFYIIDTVYDKTETIKDKKGLLSLIIEEYK